LKVSIITVVYNNRLTIADAIGSVLSQDYSEIEYIIIDGLSTDGTQEIIQSYGDRITHFVSEKDKGIYDAMNKGLMLAAGDIIGFLNADDVYADNLVIERVAAAFSDSSIEACYADLVYVNRFNLNKTVRYWKSCDFKEGLFEKGWFPPHPTFFVRRNIYEKLGGFDLDYRLAADVELMLRFLSRYRIKSVYIPEIFVRMRLGGSTNKNLSNIIRQNIEIYRACVKNNIAISPFFIILKIANRISQFLTRPVK